jgi:hypothetical protein
MARPTILIGIGSGGLRSIEYAWKLMQEMPSDVAATDRPIIHYIYMETDEQNTPCSSEIKSAPLTLGNTQTTIHALHQNPDCTTNWINGQDFPANALSGAGGSPVFGRLCAWDKNNKQYFSAILNGALSDIRNNRGKDSNSDIVVYVTGSFGGGTGSGVFLDIAYIIREELRTEIKLFGLFLIPNIGETDNVMYCNSLGALKALEYYSSDEHEYPFKWGALHPPLYEKENSPYDLVQIISTQYNKTLGKISYSELQEDAGLFLFLNALGLYDTRHKSLVDATGNIIITKYTTFGLSALRYPQTQIKEILALDLSADLLKRWIDDEYYYDKFNVQQQIQKDSVNIQNKAVSNFENKFREFLENWCTTVELIADDGLPVDIEKDLDVLAQELNSGNYSYDEKRKKVYSYFRANGRYYDVLKAQSTTGALDKIIGYIHDEISNVLSEYENLKLAEVTLDAIYKSIDHILGYWEANGITNDPNKWQENLKSMVPNVMNIPWIYKLLNEQKRVYLDRLKYELLYGLAMHIFSDFMYKIKTAISGKLDAAGNPVIVKDSSGMIELPSKKTLSDIRVCINDTIKNDDASKFSCLPYRKSLYDKLQQNKSKTLFYVYPNGDLENTLSKARITYNAQHQGQQSVKDVNGNNDLWEFLKFKTSSSNALYHAVVDKFVKNIVIQPYTVAEAVRDPQNATYIKNTATKATIPHLPVNSETRKAEFQKHDKVPHVMLGYAGAQGNLLTSIDDELRKMGVVAFQISDTDHHVLSHIGLNNWLVFYMEFGYMSDDKPFSPTSDMRDFDSFCSIYANESGKSNDAKKFHGKRIPYISYDDCSVESTKYINQATKYERDLEYENAIECYKIAKYWDISNNHPISKIAELKQKLKDEDDSAILQRYLDIALKYLKLNDYDLAGYYYNWANNKQSGSTFIQSQLTSITNVKTSVYNIVKEADEKCLGARESFNEWSLPENMGNAKLQSDCLVLYNEILAEYTSAHSQWPKNNEIKKKIDNINNFIKRLTK